MHMSSHIDVERSVEQVWLFFEDINNLARWDRSVATVVPMTPGPGRVGYAFDTIAPSKPGSNKPGMRMHYVVTELIPYKLNSAELLDSPMFKTATWTMELTPTEDGTRITCHATFSPRLQYAFLSPLLWLNKNAILRDLGYLKRTIEESYPKN